MVFIVQYVIYSVFESKKTAMHSCLSWALDTDTEKKHDYSKMN